MTEPGPAATLFHFRGETLWRGPAAVLPELRLRIETGEKVALLGPSGAGKSTLLEALRARAFREAAWCPQDQALVPPLSVFHNLYMGALDRHGALYNLANLIRPLRREREAVAALAGDLGLTEKLFTSVDRLSGGQQQRTALGRALYAKRALLLADEPVSHLDEHQGEALLRLALARHETAVVALHHQHQALSCCDRVLGLADGRVVLDRPARDLTARDLADLYS